MTRRAALFRALSLLAAILTALALFRWRLFRNLLARPSLPAVPPAYPTTTAREQARSRVVVLIGGKPQKLVEECLGRLGAADRLQVAGKKVLVKPNIVSGTPSPTTTNPEVVQGVCEWLGKQGAKTVWVGDMSAVMTLGTRRSMKSCGIEQAARQAGAVPVYFEDHDWIPTKLPGARYLKEVPISEFVHNADLVINLPVIKSHRWATYSVCLKNFVGATHGRYRPYMIDRDHWEEIISELNLAYRPALNIVDGSKVMYAGGPWRGEVAEMGLVVGGEDRVACDAVAVALMKTFPTDARLNQLGVWEQKQIRHAGQLGLGIAGPERLDLSIEPLEPPSASLHGRLTVMRRLLFG
jgi:uncharacterized protein (DUF362 family)